MTTQANKGVLVLEDGSEFEGELFGAPVTADSMKGSRRDRGYGEVVFNTSMTGYQEILTDPSYYGQIICMTAPHIGNTGVNAEDPESRQLWCGGFVIHENCEDPSNWRSKGSLDDYLKSAGIPGLSGVDTRALTLRLRSMGVIRGVILPWADRGRAKALLAELPPFEGRDLIGEVTTSEPYRWKRETGAAAKPAYKVVAMDFGVKWNLLRELEHFGCDIEVVPANTSAREILKREPDGVFLSNGPGDPAAAPYAAAAVRELVGKVPLFGVCMGHQILALALGAKTYKLKFGHRGGNQPVIDKGTGRVEISSHNHGYAVDAGSLPASLEVTHINLNDKTVEGMNVKGARAFSVQYHPEACPGPHDSVVLFERFITQMKESALERAMGAKTRGPEAMYQKYLEPIIEEFTTGEYYREVYNAKQEYFDKAGVVYEDDSEFEQRMCIFMDWYLFDRDLPGVDLPPIKYYFRRNKERFSNEELNIYRDFCSTIHSVFRLKRFTWNKQGLVVLDLFSNKTHTVVDAEINRGFARGDIFEARIIPFKGGFEFSRGFCFHPVEMESFILSEIKKVRFQDKSRQTKLILQLAAMKLKHLRFQHIDIRHIYTFQSKF